MKKLLCDGFLAVLWTCFFFFLFWVTGCETVNDYTSQRDAGLVCEQPCLQNSDCRQEMFCREDCCVFGCQEDRDCPDDYVCQNGKCQAPSPECYRNSDCSSGKYCKNSTCVADCVKDIDCGADEICDMTVGQCKVNPPPECIPENETCDGKDNDCDSLVDEELSRACTSACGTGIETCSAGQWAGSCTAPKPADEVCDGKDNDCDGEVDETLYKACETSCDKGFETCVAGKFQDCTAPQPKNEICDGMDNNCNGTKDEGCECQFGQSRKCGPETDAGECQFGIQVCVSGAWGKCMNAIEPVTETCDGKDNNCDGKIDNGLFGGELFARTCFTSCGLGIEICTNGTWGDCNAPQPQTEVCDGEDNDCDGEIDEGVKNACGQCGATPVEVCDGQDNDCDGQIDDNCRCAENATQPCSSDVGECKLGTQTCRNGQWSACSGIIPAPEICDGKDNDCDGKTDENFDAGVECSVGVGECKRTGVKVCKDTTSTKCNVTAGQPTDEVCDGKDNDCDGEKDETFGKITCGIGICQRRVYACVEGEVQVCTPGAPATETCDNELDDDCDGTIDEGCPPIPPTPAELTSTYSDVNATTFVWYDDNKSVNGKGSVKAPVEGRCWVDVRAQKSDGWTSGCGNFTFSITDGYLYETGSFRDRYDPNGYNCEIYTGKTVQEVAACKQSRQLINQTTGD